MNISDPVMGALFILTIAGVWLWWAYAAGVIVGLYCVLRSRDRVQDFGLLTLLANLAPVAVLLIVFPVAFVVQILINGPLPDWLVIGPTVLGLAVGPLATLWLLGVIVWAKIRRERPVA